MTLKVAVPMEINKVLFIYLFINLFVVGSNCSSGV